MDLLARTTRTQDRELGQATVFGGSRGAMAAFIAEGGLFLVVLARSVAMVGLGGVDPAYYWITAIAVAVGLSGAVWVLRTRLVVGASGFRYERPFARQQWLWSEVVSVDTQGFDTSTLQLVVRLRIDAYRDRQFRLPLYPGLATSATELVYAMRESMEHCHVANGRASAAFSRSMPPEPTRPLANGSVIHDPELGAGSVVGSGRTWLVPAVMGFGVLVYLVWAYAIGPAKNQPTAGQTAMIGGAGVLLAAVAVLAKRTRLVVGQEGFRYTRPFRRLEVRWRQVGRATVEGDGRRLKLTVPFTDTKGRSRKFSPYNVFSTNPAEIRDLMNAARRLKVGDED